MSDAGVEYPFLRGVADRLMAALTASGWRCEVVTPAVEKKTVLHDLRSRRDADTSKRAQDALVYAVHEN